MLIFQSASSTSNPHLATSICSSHIHSRNKYSPGYMRRKPHHQKRHRRLHHSALPRNKSPSSNSSPTNVTPTPPNHGLLPPEPFLWRIPITAPNYYMNFSNYGSVIPSHAAFGVFAKGADVGEDAVCAYSRRYDRV